MNRTGSNSVRSLASIKRLNKSLQLKMDKMSERLFDVLKSGFMVKRAQNKKRFTPVNYKQRWFELTKNTLSYFDMENMDVSTVNLLVNCYLSSVLFVWRLLYVYIIYGGDSLTLVFILVIVRYLQFKSFQENLKNYSLNLWWKFLMGNMRI